MFKEQMNKLKKIFIKKEGETKLTDPSKKTNKRKVENLVFFLIISIVTLIVINTILSGNEKEVKEEQSPYKVLANSDVTKKEDGKTSNELEEKLEKILSTMNGIRKSKCFSYIYTV